MYTILAIFFLYTIFFLYNDVIQWFPKWTDMSPHPTSPVGGEKAQGGSEVFWVQSVIFQMSFSRRTLHHISTWLWKCFSHSLQAILGWTNRMFQKCQSIFSAGKRRPNRKVLEPLKYLMNITHKTVSTMTKYSTMITNFTVFN